MASGRSSVRDREKEKGGVKGLNGFKPKAKENDAGSKSRGSGGGEGGGEKKKEAKEILNNEEVKREYLNGLVLE